MYSRPYEGLVASLPAAVVLFVWMVKSAMRGGVAEGLSAMAATMVVLVPAVAWMAGYHAAVTGDPLVMPVNVHDVAYNARPTFLWQKVEGGAPVPASGNGRLLRRLGTAAVHQAAGVFRVNPGLGTRVPIFYQFFIGVVFALPLAALWRNCRDRWMWLAAITCGLVFLVLTQAICLMPHYAAPITALILVQAVAGMRILRGWRWKGAARPLAVGRHYYGLPAGVCRALEHKVELGPNPPSPAGGPAAAGTRRRAPPGLRALLA